MLLFAHRPPARIQVFKLAPVAVALLVLGGLLATAVTQQQTDSLTVLLRVIYVASVLPWQAQQLLRTPDQMASGVKYFAGGSAVCGFGGLMQFAISPTIIPGSDVTNAGRFSGFTAHVSDLGGITAVAVVVSVAVLSGTTRQGRLAYPLFLVAGLIGLILSGSVSGMIAALVGSLLALLWNGVKPLRLCLVGGTIAAGVWVANYIIEKTSNALSPLERLAQTMGYAGQSTSLNTSASRVETFRLGLEGFLANPITGVGLDGKAGIVYGNLDVHSLFVAVLYQGGIVYAAGLLMIVIFAVLKGLGMVRRRRHIVPELAMAATAVVFAATAPSMYNRYFWVPIALLVAQIAMETRQSGESAPAGSKSECADPFPKQQTRVQHRSHPRWANNNERSGP